MAPTTLVLLGRTGNGKSSTGNSILGRNAFNSFWSFSSVTKECKMDTRTWKDGRELNVIDTPGLFDTNVPKQTIHKEIVKCINLAKDGLHAVLLVLSIKNRFTEEEAEAVDNMEMLFGPSLVNYMVIVFTNGDQLENDGTTLEVCMEEFPTNLKILETEAYKLGKVIDNQRIINRCNSRMVVFNNLKNASATTKENQITQLLEHVDRIVADNENQLYSNELFAKAQLMTSQLFHIKDKEKVYEEQIKHLNEMMERNMREMEERMRRVTTELQEQLKAACAARAAATNEAASIKKDLERQVRDLENNLEEARKKLEEKEKRGGCSIL